MKDVFSHICGSGEDFDADAGISSACDGYVGDVGVGFEACSGFGWLVGFDLMIVCEKCHDFVHVVEVDKATETVGEA